MILNFTMGEQKNVCSLPFHYVIFKFQSSLEYTFGIKTRFIMLIMLSFAQSLTSCLCFYNTCCYLASKSSLTLCDRMNCSLFNFYAEYIMRNAGLEETQAGIKIAGRNINNLRYADDTTLVAESEEELKSLLMKVKVESEKLGLKLNIQKTTIMVSGLITSWEIDGETVETVSDFIFGGSKLQMVTAAMKLKDAYSLEEKL